VTARPGAPHHPADHHPMVHPLVTMTRRAIWQQRLLQRPLHIRLVMSLKHPVDLPQPRSSVRGTRRSPVLGRTEGGGRAEGGSAPPRLSPRTSRPGRYGRPLIQSVWRLARASDVGRDRITDTGVMPELQFVGKEFVWNHHLSVPYRPLNPDVEASVGETSLTGNLVVHGDNLHALKALLPGYAGKIDVVYIDPPYNTGKESWRYNDNVKSPMAQEWLDGNPVNKDDMLRHDKWLALMYPRLKLFRELLSEEGVIFASIDDNELYHLRLALDEIFGETNWVGTIVWRNVTDNNPTNIAIEHEYVICFAKEKSQIATVWRTSESAIKERLVAVQQELIDSHEDDDSLRAAYRVWFKENKWELGTLDRYKFIDRDGIFTGSQSVHNPGREGYRYNVLHPVTHLPTRQPLFGYRFPETTMTRLMDEGRLLFGEDENKIVELKVYASEFEDKLPSVITFDGRLGTSELKALFPEQDKVFDNPKPTQLIKQLIAAASKSDSIVLDSFAGSGTTAHAVLALNHEDGGQRKFILIEGEDYAYDLTAERVRRVIKGVPNHRDSSLAAGLGGEFTFCELGEALDLDSMLTGDRLPDFETLGGWLFHTATGLPADRSLFDESAGYLGEASGQHIWLRYQPDLNFLMSPNSALTMSAAQEYGSLREGRHLVFATSKFVTHQKLAALSVEFSPLPFSLYHVSTE